MKVSKYPITSSHNNRYKAVIKRQRHRLYNDTLTCNLYKMVWFIPIPVYKESADYIYINDLRSFVQSVVSSYEYSKGFGMEVHNKLDEFKQWDGNLSKEIK